MNDRVSINKVLSSKPIYSTCFSGLSVFSGNVFANILQAFPRDKFQIS